jgi:indolepyruvate ferredoxin oxidoreductase alpha subunit
MTHIHKKALLIGNEAIGRGAIEAGVSFASSYPGTPATQILEYLAAHCSGQVEWAVNEKVALESAIGATYAGKRALCSMKHVGLNVAADPLMTAAYLGVQGGLVLAIGDDPGAYSSQNEQDSRMYARFAKIPCLEPADSQEAKDFTKLAFDLSEKFHLPVMLRGLTRVMHSSSPVTLDEPRQENPLNIVKNPDQMLAIPKNIVRLHKALNQKQQEIKDWVEKSGLNVILRPGRKKGIIACGFAHVYAGEYGTECSILKISAYPFHEQLIKDFVSDLDEVWVLEEGEPLVEEIARRYSSKVKGKLSGEISREGELGPDVLASYFGTQSAAQKNRTLESPLPMRPPVLCPGCPHREFYKALKVVSPTFTTGDIGCYTLGAAPPLNAIDTCLCMGASIGKAAGMANVGVKRVAAVIGDSTFIHSGITGLINAVYNNANILVCILDNATTAMTGHQPTPLLGVTAKGSSAEKIDLETLCQACGVTSVTVIDPLKQDDMEKILREKIDASGVNVVISRRPCILTKRKTKTPE